MTVIMAAANYYIFLPAWGLGQGEIPGLVLTAIVPFNVIKSFSSAAITFVLYKRVRAYL